jgi:hypothetical protein
LVAKQVSMIEDWHSNWSCVNMLVPYWMKRQVICVHPI